MGEPGRFLELATIDNNVINAENEILESLFESGDTEGSLVAVISALGSLRSGKSKLLGQMLKYLHQENSIQIDENVADRIPTFGDDPNQNRRCIVTWSKPFFVRKGVKKRIAVYLLDIKGNFPNSNDKDYIMLSGLCASISSSILYLHGDHIDDVAWKHLTNVTLEGLRYIGNKEMLIHQEMIYVIQNWNKLDKYTYGDKDSARFCSGLKDHFKGSSREKVFSAFEQFKFFLLPETTSSRYTSIVNKLLTNTLDSGYITTKSFGGDINTGDVSLYLQHHIEAVNYDDEYKGEFSDIKSLSGVKKTDILETPQSSLTQTNTSMSQSYYDMINESENEMGKEISDEINEEKLVLNTTTEEELPYADVQQKLLEIQEESKPAFSSSSDIDANNYSEGYVLPKDEFPESFETQNNNDLHRPEDMDTEMIFVGNAAAGDNESHSSEPTHDYLPKFAPTNNEDAYDYSEAMKQFALQNQIEDSFLKPNKVPLSVASPAEILKQLNMKTEEKNASQPQVPFSESLINFPKSVGNLNFSEQSQLTTDKQKTLETVHITSQKEKPKFNEKPKRPNSAILTDERKTTEVMSTVTAPSRQTLDKETVRKYVRKAFEESQLGENKSADDILKQVSYVIGSQDSKTIIWAEAVTVSQAIKAVMKYVEGMESIFQKSLSFSDSEFERQHRNIQPLAMNGLNASSYLKKEVEKKISDAKNEFLRHNRSILQQNKRIIDYVVEKVKVAYEKEINSITQKPMNEESLKSAHENLKAKLLNAALKIKQWDQSTLSSEIERQVSTYLKTQFERIQRKKTEEKKLLKGKIDLAACASKLYYESEMNKMLLSGVLSQMSQLENLHETKLSEALRQFDQTPDVKEAAYLATEPRRCLELELLKSHATIKAEFEEKLKKLASIEATQPKVKHNFNFQNSSAESNQNAKDNQYSEASGAKSEFGLGIHFEDSGATVSLFQKNKIEKVGNIPDLVIGYQGQIVIGSDKTAAGNRHINLRSLFKGNIGQKFKVNWDGTNYEFRFEECISMILSRWRYIYQKSFNCHIKICVIAVPSYLTNIEEQAMHDAAQMSGFEHIKILRDISAAVVGLSFFSDTKYFPKKFVMINVLTEKWDAGLYDITESLKVKVISGDNFTTLPYFGDKTKARFQSFITDIWKISKGAKAATVDVMLLGNGRDNHSLNMQTVRACKGVQEARFKDEHLVASGCAFIAALMAGDVDAAKRWHERHPNSSSQRPKYQWSTVDQSWDEPLKSGTSKRKVIGINLKSEELLRLQQRLRQFVLTKEEATEEANGILLSFSKKVQYSSMSEMACKALNMRINDAFTLLRKDSSLVADIDRAIQGVQQYYETYCRVTPMEH